MRHLALRLALAAAAALPGAAAHAGTKLDGNDRDILRHDISAGGGAVASAGLKLNGRVGTVGTTEFSGGALKVRSGLMRVLPQPGTITQLQLLTKSTDTLDLTWTAPGLDGYAANVTGGRYRIDYSSETGHLFSPTTYQIELATNVIVGAAESYRLTGLSPYSTYYVKIYLAGPDRFFAEDSKRLDESTLANAPVNPFFSMVGLSSVTISWLLPVGGTGGYDLQGASTTLGLSLGGGSVTSSQTANGQLLSLMLQGLRSGTTYFFKVASLNWQGDRTFTTVISTVTQLSPDPLPVENLAAFTDDLGRRVRLAWDVPPFQAQQGVLVLFSTSPAALPVVNGTPFAAGQQLSDASVVRSTRLASAYNDPGPLALDTTFYYHLYTYGNAVAPFTYSVVVSTQVFLDLPPNAPAGLSSFLSPDRKQVAISWNPVVSNDDGTPFASTSTPRTVEITRYDVFRSTSVERGGWTRVSSSPVPGNFFTEAIPDPNQTFYYRVAAVDVFERSQRSLAVDTQGDFYVLSPDDISRFRFPSALSKELLSGGNKYATDLTIRASTLPATGQDRIFKATAFEVLKLPRNEPVKDFFFSQPSAELALHYDVVGGLVVPSDVATALATGGAAPTGEPLGGTISAGEADRRLGMYWNNGQKFVKLFGRVDTGAQLVRVQTSMPGTYQVRGLARQSAFDFDLSGISNKAITPNGDGRNDQAIFTFDNPRDSQIAGEVFDVNGARIASMAPGPLGNTLKWDGTANGRAVPSGVYVYQIRGEGKTFNGTVVVIR